MFPPKMDAAVCRYAGGLGIGTCIWFSPSLLVPEERIRALCRADKCNNFGKNYMCPPYIGTIEEIAARLARYEHGLLFQYTRAVDVRGNVPALLKTKDDFHRKILEMESFLEGRGFREIWGFIGGNCGLCRPCRVVKGEPCPHPRRARTSLESIAVDVQQLLARFGLDMEFKPDEVTWTGAVLFVGQPVAELKNRNRRTQVR